MKKKSVIELYNNSEVFMKDIKGYEGLYAVTNNGKVWSYKSNKFLSPSKDKNGYLRVVLCKDKRKYYVKIHKLVAETFIENPNNFNCINHKDEVKDNNSMENLEWCTVEYNINYGTRTERAAKTQTGMKRSDIAKEHMRMSKKNRRSVLCVEKNIVYNSIREAAKMCNIERNTISKCCKKIKNYNTAGGYHWEYYVPHEEEV